MVWIIQYSQISHVWQLDKAILSDIYSKETFSMFETVL